MSDAQMLNRGPTHSQVDDEGYTHGYCDADGNFLGYASYMTLIPDLIPAKFHVKSGMVVPTGNQKVLPKGRVLTTDAGFGGQEQVLDGLVDDRGSGLAPTGAIPGTAIPTVPELNISPELRARIEQRNEAKAAKAAKAEEAAGQTPPPSGDNT